MDALIFRSDVDLVVFGFIWVRGSEGQNEGKDRVSPTKIFFFGSKLNFLKLFFLMSGNFFFFFLLLKDVLISIW